jgi:hypothetical protein
MRWAEQSLAPDKEHSASAPNLDKISVVAFGCGLHSARDCAVLRRDKHLGDSHGLSFHDTTTYIQHHAPDSTYNRLTIGRVLSKQVEGR